MKDTGLRSIISQRRGGFGSRLPPDIASYGFLPQKFSFSISTSVQSPTIGNFTTVGRTTGPRPPHLNLSSLHDTICTSTRRLGVAMSCSHRGKSYVMADGSKGDSMKKVLIAIWLLGLLAVVGCGSGSPSSSTPTSSTSSLVVGHTFVGTRGGGVTQTYAFDKSGKVFKTTEYPNNPLKYQVPYEIVGDKVIVEVGQPPIIFFISTDGDVLREENGNEWHKQE